MSRNEYTIGTHKELNQQQNAVPGPGGRGRRPGTGNSEKAKDFSGTWGKLITYCRSYLPAIVIALLLACVGVAFNLIGPDRLSNMTDLITEGLTGEMNLEAIGSIALLLTVLYVLGYLFNYAQGFIMATVSQRIAKGLRTDISTKINRLPFSYFNKNSVGDVMSRITNDADTIGQTLNQSIGSLVSALAMFIGCLIMMFLNNVIMAVVAVLSSVIGFALMLVIISHSQKYFDRQQQGLGAVNGHVEEVFAGHTVVRAYNGESEAKGIFKKINDKLYDSAWKAQFLSGLMPTIMGFIGNLGYVAVCVAGAILTMNGSISFGVIVAFMLYVRLFSQPLNQLAQAATTLQSTAAASERVFEFLEEEELSDESGKIAELSEVRGEVIFENVSFSYTEDNPVIKNFSAKAKAGEKIAIVGPTGAGKTTIVNLLMRFYELQSGSIKVDGISTAEMTRERVHDLFCMVLQDTWLFHGTVRENIVFNKTGVSDEQVIEACKAAGIHHFIMTLQQGYDTVLDDNTALSAGQKQLLTIARAMVEDAPMLILDEATSSVDTRTEILIQQAMDKLMQGRTSFVIAHRLSTIKNAHLILVMNEGDIIESGAHEDLLAQKGFYAELYNSQFEEAA